MPRSNVIKQYTSEAIYHLYNRGNQQRPIFFHEKDYWVFRRQARKIISNLDGRIELVVFALLENHFHFLVRQKDERDIVLFMRRLMNSYRLFLKEKYLYKGRLFESSYKGVLIESDRQLADTRRYILTNPIEAGLTQWPHVGDKL